MKSGAIPQKLVFLIWAAAAVLAGGVLTSFHQAFVLPGEGIAALAPSANPGAPQWKAIHLLTAGCGCSEKLSHYLAARPGLEGIEEQAIFIGAEDPFGTRSAIEAAGIRVSSTAPETAVAMGVKGVPLLVIVSPKGQVKYLGGYGIGSYKDQEIWQQVRAGEEPRKYPVLGCAIGNQLRKQTDPFRWKY